MQAPVGVVVGVGVGVVVRVGVGVGVVVRVDVGVGVGEPAWSTTVVSEYGAMVTLEEEPDAEVIALLFSP